MELSIGNETFKVNFPPTHNLPMENGLSFDESTSAVVPLLPNNQSIPQGVFHDADIFGAFRGILMQLCLLWESLVIGEPILIIVPTPSECCEAVASLVSLTT